MHPTAKTALLLLAAALLPLPAAARRPAPVALDAPALEPDKAALRLRAAVQGATAALQPLAPELHLESDAVSLTLDAFGSFGSSTSGSDARFDDGSHVAGTVFEYMVHARGVGFLDGDALLLPPDRVHLERDGGAVLASYELGAFAFEVRSELLDCDSPNCAWLVQDWSVTNLTDADQALELTPYLDGDLFFSGDFGNDYGARAGDVLYQFDSGSDPAAPSTYLGLSTEAPSALRIVREVGEYSEQRRRIRSGGLLIDGFRRADGHDGDADDDGVTDSGYDVSIASSHDFGALAPGETATLRVRLQWGLGALDDIDELPELVPDAGPDQLVECEGLEGTLVRLDGSASEPAELLVAHRWWLGAELVGEGATAELLLPPGEHLLRLEVEDEEGRLASDELLVSVVDSSPPLVEGGAPIELWPPNHRLVEVVPPVRLFDPCSSSVSLHLIGVLVDEEAEVGAGGDGHTAADVVLTEDGRLFLRAERQGGGDGRVYRVLARATDEAGNVEPFSFDVSVPHSRRAPAAYSGAITAVDFP